MELIAKRRYVPLTDGKSYNLRLYATNRVDSMGKQILAYRFADSDGIIFQGDDFHASPMHSIDSRETVEALMGFLTLRSGDTDTEYFAAYTERQMDFAKSYACEVLAGMARS